MTEKAPAAAAGYYPQTDGTTAYWDGTRWAPDPALAAGLTKPVDDKAVTRSAWIKFGVIAAIVVGGVWACSASSGSSKSTPTEYDAWSNCQELESKQLKAPATAGYPLLSELKWSKVGDTWTFPKAWVDAQNSFGAQIRTGFSCTVTDTHDGFFNVHVLPL